MSLFEDKSCGCGPAPHPAPPDIPAGLGELSARQTSGFPEYRAAQLAEIPLKTALSGWRARGEADLGVMLLEAWSYVLDVTGFYDARIAERAYIQTAPDAASAQRLAALLGHRLRGAVAARVTLALQADGADPAPLKKGVAFRSEAFDTEPPQVFELDADTTIWPQRNAWRLAPVRSTTFDGTLRFLPRQGPAAGAIVLAASGAAAAVGRVATVNTETGQDGASYVRVAFETASALAPLAGLPIAGLKAMILRLPLGPNGFTTAFTSKPATNQADLVLDAVYAQVRAGDWAAVEIAGVLHAVKIDAASVILVTVDSATGAKQGATQVTFTPNLSFTTGQALVFHASPFALGAPVRTAKVEISLADVQGGADLLAPIAPLGEAPAGGDMALVGKRAEGARISGSILEEGEGAARLQPGQNAEPFPATLATPVDVLGNLVEAVRGETVIDEALGSADGSQPFNRFTLKKQPLVWREDASQPDGRRPDLTVRVGGLVWTRADTFFGRGPTDEIYVARQEADGTTSITFGDGVRGARPPTGVDNIRADYRFGAGKATPPPGTIDQIANRVKGLASVRGPLKATGGADAETADELRTAAPASALTIGRAVSLADYEALARGFGGVVNVQAGWIWDEGRQRAAAKLWVISDGALSENGLAAWLTGQGVPDLIVVVEAAQPAPFTSLAISLEIGDRYDPDQTRASVRAVLFDPKSGFLSPARQTIGGALFRSALTAAIHQVAGVVSVPAILLDGLPMPSAVGPGMGRWFDLEAGASVT